MPHAIEDLTTSNDYLTTRSNDLGHPFRPIKSGHLTTLRMKTPKGPLICQLGTLQSSDTISYCSVTGSFIRFAFMQYRAAGLSGPFHGLQTSASSHFSVHPCRS